MVDLNGAMTCARYAFAPNFFHYCGPDTGGEFGEYLNAEVTDGGLVEHLTNFEVMYPYLAVIAHANKIADPLDHRVVEAYWVGNEMLEKVTEQDMCVALSEKQRLQKRISKDDIKWLLPKIDQKARLHHSFHVFNVFTRTGHHTVEHTVGTMDECRISWGRVASTKHKAQSTKLNSNSQITIKSQKLVYRDGKLFFEPTIREVVVPGGVMGARLKAGDFVSVHWGFVCDILSPTQVNILRRYTDHHLMLANETI